ncbi:MAG: beta-N-acetylhexosaminidase [Chloroflexota bacterium]
MKNINDRVGQMLMAGFDGLTAPDYLLEWLQEGRLGGVILFARNVESPAQLAALTRQLHSAAKYPLLISIDQEGGTVARLRDCFTESPGAMALASITGNAESVTEDVSRVLAEEMQALGINWTYAPVVDISYNAENPTVGTRSFGSDQERVAALAAAAIRGFQLGGVAACAKHFPGLGNTTVDTHLALPRLDTPIDHLLHVDLLPYRVATANDLATIMTTHTIFSTLDPDHPATLSSHIISQLIRAELGFDGVVTSDCMEMKAIDDHYGVEESSVRAANAGVDIILFSHTPAKQAAAYESLLAAVKRGDVSEDTVNAANARIERLKARFPVGQVDAEQVYSEQHRALVGAAARAGVTLLREEPGVLPLHPDDDRRVMLVELASRRDSLVQDENGYSPLARLIQAYLPDVHYVRLSASPDQAEIAAVLGTDVDVLVLATRSAHLIPAQADIVRKLAEHGAERVLVALRNPYDAGLIDGGTVICTAGDSSPSLQAAADMLVGHFEPSGRLPVES